MGFFENWVNGMVGNFVELVKWDRVKWDSRLIWSVGNLGQWVIWSVGNLGQWVKDTS